MNLEIQFLEKQTKKQLQIYSDTINCRYNILVHIHFEDYCKISDEKKKEKMSRKYESGILFLKGYRYDLNCRKN